MSGSTDDKPNTALEHVRGSGRPHRDALEIRRIHSANADIHSMLRTRYGTPVSELKNKSEPKSSKNLVSNMATMALKQKSILKK